MSDRSNILKIFNPSTRNNSEINKYEDCTGCNVFNALFLLTGGGYLLSGYATRNTGKPKWSVAEYNRIHPKWWRTSLRSVGGAVVLFGLYRSVETYQLWTQQKEHKLESE